MNLTTLRQQIYTIGATVSGSNGGSGFIVIKYPSSITGTFSAGITRTTNTAGGFTTVQITATSTTNETVTFT